MALAERPPALSPQQQTTLLEGALPQEQGFARSLGQRGLTPPRRSPLRVLQLNLGRLCNMRCSHCHVDAGPHQGHTLMPDGVVEACISAIARLKPAVLDLTGGAPELHPRFRDLVLAARSQGCQVIDRCNLTVLLLPALHDLAPFLASQQVEIVASLPQPDADATDGQRGEGTWEASIQALRLLNGLGYGQGDPTRQLTLMSNPAGTQLQQISAWDQRRWAERLEQLAGVRFDRLIGLNNMPIARFLQQLQRDGHVNCYLALLERAFNPAALEGLMCRDTLSVAPDGRLHDCDFNQMLEMPQASGATIATISREQLLNGAIHWGNHCYGCTAGQGSSCGGATA
ncbi:MAG: radical SAM/Cys-rich domain protein [Synechococcaceae bacterium WBB_3_034]|nr:radical SAM/Cys-rich domain protein [Synechococcaceae bacterium WBB_3_034]